jgi:hypothetical protein
MYYVKNLYMLRAMLCSSSGGQNCIFTVSGIVTLCERPCIAPVESGLRARSEKHQITYIKTVRKFLDAMFCLRRLPAALQQI